MLNMLWLQTLIENKNLKKIKCINTFLTLLWWCLFDTTINDNFEETLKRHNDLQKNTNRFSIYTDSSSYNEGVKAITVFSQAEYRLYLDITKEVTVYATELIEVMIAFDIIRFLITKNHDQERKEYNIYTDNQTVIKAVQTDYTKSEQEILRKIKKMLKQIWESTTVNITIIWTSVHLKTSDNEHMNQAAKKTAEKDVQISQSLKYTLKSLITVIKMQFTCRWQKEWKQD